MLVIRVRQILLLVCAGLLSACAGLLESGVPPLSTYTLAPYLHSEPAADTLGGTLAIRVETGPGLDTNRLPTRAPQGVSSYISGARWPDYLPEMSASLLRDAVEHAGIYRRVIAAPIRATFDCLLDLRANEFHTRLGVAGRPESVELGLQGSLSCGEREVPIGLRHSEPVRGQGVTAVIAAHQAAFDALSRSLLDQLQAAGGGGGSGD